MPTKYKENGQTIVRYTEEELRDLPSQIDWERVTIRLDHDVLQWFRTKKKKGYQTAINAVLKAFVESQKQNEA
ncbi:BrnA antitoxin family protein [Desulfovibrio inopinatus]|uniref:BrnA antitoxin family protein n=1 Tax=Desulfovibrio inopinatus TaxID=102109 RepID=UPI0004250C92|nr:BrnA antitoxin family protein [Desulfovibrio inopinatus]